MRRRTLVLAAAATLLLPISPVSAQNQGYVPIEARIWLDHGVEPILHSGDRVQVFYRTNYDAYVSIFHINTDGRVTLLHPSSPGSPHYVRGGRDYRLRISNRDYWRVQDDAGVGYFFVLASPTPFDFGAFPSAGYGGWNLMSVGSEVYRDPFVAMDDYVSYLIPDWTQAEYALDFSLYNIVNAYRKPSVIP